jgi:hypothetical protein
LYRGQDATGIAAVDTSNQVTVFKEAVPSYTFFNTLSSPNEIIKKANNKVLIGHTRAATRGDKTTANAHPFLFDNVVGAHNGTLEHFCMEQYTQKPVRYGTDSQGIYAKINEVGFEGTIPNLEGAWALTAWDRVDNAVKIIRNNQRTLFYCTMKNGTIFWASEVDTIDFAIQKMGLDDEIVRDRKGYGYFVFEENTLYTFDLVSDKPKTKTLKSEKVYKYVNPHVTYGAGNHAASKVAPANQTNLPWNATKQETQKNVDTITPVEGFTDPKDINYYLAPTGSEDGAKLNLSFSKEGDPIFIGEKDFKENHGDKCTLCGGDIDWDKGYVLDTTDKDPSNLHKAGPVCHKCVNQQPGLLALSYEYLTEVAA